MLYILAENKLWWATDRLKSVYGLCFHLMLIQTLFLEWIYYSQQIFKRIMVGNNLVECRNYWMNKRMFLIVEGGWIYLGNTNMHLMQPHSCLGNKNEPDLKY